MTLTNPTATIQALSDKLTASGALPVGTTLWYPDAPEDTAAPYCVLQATTRRVKVGEGLGAFLTGSGALNLYVSDTIGNVEEVADDICDALTADVGLRISDPEQDLATATADGDPADTPRNISITFTIGIGA